MIQHLACIMDGNRRWAKKRGWLPWYGHREGIQASKRVMNFCIAKKIPYLSLYTFSTENLKRSELEKDFLFTTLVHEAHAELQMLKEQGIRIQFIGDRTLFPQSVVAMCDKVEQETALGNALCVNLLFCYGARQEIMHAIKKVVQDVQHGAYTEQDITEDYFKQQLWAGNMPDPDMIIRTGGMHRLSNFLLYQAAYSELYFLDCLWPEIQIKDLEKALDYFNACQRNFGV